MNIDEVLKHGNEFKYMLLSRMQGDCEYYLGNGSRLDKNLWAANPAEHIKYMKAIYNSLQDKPEWLTLEQINNFESQMKVTA